MQFAVPRQVSGLPKLPTLWIGAALAVDPHCLEEMGFQAPHPNTEPNSDCINPYALLLPARTHVRADGDVVLASPAGRSWYDHGQGLREQPTRGFAIPRSPHTTHDTARQRWRSGGGRNPKTQSYISGTGAAAGNVVRTGFSTGVRISATWAGNGPC